VARDTPRTPATSAIVRSGSNVLADEYDVAAATSWLLMSNSKKHSDGANYFSDRSAQRLEVVRLELQLCESVNLLWDGEPAPTEKATPQEIRAAAHSIFLAVQSELEMRGEGFQPRYHAERTALFDLWRAQRQAEKAGAVDPDERTAPRVGRAKQLQLEASKGRPLAACIGRSWCKRPALPYSATSQGRIVFFTRGDGCGIIFRDSASLKRPQFHSYCPRCRKRKLERELKGRLKAGLWGRQSVPLPNGSCYFIGNCSACKAVFKTFDVRQERCQKCHDAHRSPPPGFLRTSAG
jgi:hypothetical protein